MENEKEYVILDFLNSSGAIVGSIKESEVQEVEDSNTSKTSILKRSTYKLRNQVVLNNNDIFLKIEKYKSLVDKGLLKLVEHDVLMEDGCLYRHCLIITQNRVEAPIDNSILFIVTQFNEVVLYSLDNLKVYKIKTDDIYEIQSKVSNGKTIVLNKDITN